MASVAEIGQMETGSGSVSREAQKRLWAVVVVLGNETVTVEMESR